MACDMKRQWLSHPDTTLAGCSIFPFVRSAPVQGVPSDILQEIFLRCLNPDRWKITISPSEAPILLTQVCKQWRSTAIEFAQLWIWLKVQLRPGMVGTDAEVSHPLLSVLRRTKGSSFNLQLDVSPSLHGLPQIPEIPIQFVVPISHSLTRLAINGVPPSHIQSLPPDFPNLQRLHIQMIPDVYMQPPSEYRIRAFEDAPSLRRVSLNLFHLGGFDTVSVDLPWAQLTHFMNIGDENDGNLTFTTATLARCTNLQWLSLESVTPGGFTTGLQSVDRPRMVMRNLHSLSLCSVEDGSRGVKYPDILRCYTLPHLRLLRIEGEWFDPYSFWRNSTVEEFFGKLKDEFIHLDSFAISSRELLSRTVDAIIQSVLRVSTLDIQVTGGYQYLFTSLTLRPDAGHLPLPHLRIIIWVMHLSRYANEGAEFLALIRSRMRCSPENRLRKVILYGIRDRSRFYDEDTIEDDNDSQLIRDLEGFIPEGLVLEHHEDFSLHWMARDPHMQNWLEAMDPSRVFREADAS